MPDKLPSPPRPTNFRWVVFALACGTSWLLYVHRYAIGAIKPKLQTEFGLGNDELGLLDSAFSLSYTLFQFPLGVATDAFGVHLVLPILILLWCVGLGLNPAASSPSQLWYARATLGVGQSAVYAGLSRIGPMWYPPALRTTLQGIVGITSGRLGGLCGYLLVGSLLMGVLKLDWRTAIYIVTAAGIVLALLFIVLFRNTPRKHWLVNETEAEMIEGSTEGVAAGAKPPRMTTREMLRSLKPRAMLNLAALNVQTILSTIADNFYSNWISIFLVQVYQLGDTASGICAAMPLVGGAIAGAVGGLLSDFLIARTGNRRWARSGVGLAGKGMAAVLIMLSLVFFSNPYVFCACLLLVKLFGDWSMAATWGAVNDMGGRASASVFAFNNTVAGLGLIVAPTAIGFLSKHYGWPVVFVGISVTYALCALSWLAINCTIPMIETSVAERLPEK